MALRSYQYQIQAVVVGSTAITKSETSPLGFTSSADFGDFVDVETQIEFLQFAVGTVDLSGTNFVESELGLTQTTHVFGYEQVETDLALVSVAEALFPISQEAGSPLFFVSSATVNQDLGVSAESILVLTSNALIPVELSASTVIPFVSEGAAVWSGESDLNFVSLAEWGYGFTAESELNLIDLGEVELSLNRGAITADIVFQSASYFIENRCNRLRFNTFDGTGGVAPNPKKLNYTNSFVMVSLDDGTKIELRNPETDDRRRYSFNRVNRTFYDGSADVYSDPSWVTEQTQIYTIVAVKREKLDSIFTFMQDNLGREILIKDWKGVSWIVIITNPGEVYTEDSEGYWTIDFEVVGEAINGELALQFLGITDDVSRAGSEWLRSGNNTDVVTDTSNQAILLSQYDQSQDLTLGSLATFTIV